MSVQGVKNEIFSDVDIVKKYLDKGGFILSSALELGDYPRHLCIYLQHWAEQKPDTVFLAERTASGAWREVTYSECLTYTRSIAQALLDNGLSAERSVMILSDNSVDSGLLILGAMYAGVPVAPISPAYSLMSEDHGKLKHIHSIIQPGLIYADNYERFAGAINALQPDGVVILTSQEGISGNGLNITQFNEYASHAPGEGLDRVYEQIDENAVAKILFTSGSTAMPKGVINTHRMMCSNQEAVAMLWPFVEQSPPILVDWLPWNHTFGCNFNFNMVLRNGGTLYIDAGKPVPPLIGKSVENLKDIAPTVYLNVPRGFDMMIPLLEADPTFRDHFFSRLDLIFFAGAALPQDLWTRLEKLAEAAGATTTLATALGSTETAPVTTLVHFPTNNPTAVGKPIPGTEVKMVPNGGKMELRIKGPNITPGYYKQPELTEKAFDEDGFYMIGDAVKLIDENDADKGIKFDGRVAEDFKLTSGTWVNVGMLRLAVISACSPLINDAVIAGHNEEKIGLMAFPNIPAICDMFCIDPQISPVQILQDQRVVQTLSEKLKEYNAHNPGSSTKISRAIFLLDPPNIDANEITDKGYLNQRAILENRASIVESLYKDGAGVIVL